jgi:nicotinamidase/pyrazinamidase
VKTVFVDVDTQIDFLYPAGALYVPGAEEIVPAIARLNQHAAAAGIPVISTVDAHTENDVEFHSWPPHCVTGTVGQQKPATTITGTQLVVRTKSGTYSPAGVEQIVLQKLHNDPFTNPNLLPILRQLGGERYIVYGVVTEICVRHAAMGLLNTGARVELVTDAVKSLDESKGSEMVHEFTARGGALITADQAMAR